MKMMPKRIWVLLTVLVLVAGLLGMTAFAANQDPADDPVCYEHGDVNSDGMVTGEDAVYLLYASFGTMFEDDYPLSQDGDLDCDGAVTGDDAVYLLYASFGEMFKEQYPLNGTVHNYFDPIWTWNTDATEPTAQVSLKCACGENHTITDGITITAGTVVEPTCVATGSKEYTGSVTFDSHTYENTVTVTVPALGENGHTIVGEPTCEEGVKCQNCDYTIEALGHSYVDNGEKIEGCKHTELYKCACGSEVEGDVYYTHTYTAELVEEASCTKAGKKVLTCSCGDTQEETVPINPEFHVWGEAVTENGVTTQTCACGATKTVVVMSDNGVAADALKDSEVQLDGGTSVALDENTADQLDADKSVVIKVEQVDKNQTGMSDEEKAQVGNNTIYDFSMQYSDGTPITSFSGEVTVSLPHTLQEGDDVNAIDVWFIADDGTVECVKGVYSNGYVTFKTNHFSYYTVTRLTPEQRCAVYGHSMVERSKEANCTEDGYHKIFCQRCGLEEKNEVLAMLGHDYQKNEELSKDATCDAPGKLATQCTHCGHKRLQEVKQLSHQWSIETVAPSCSGKGYDKRTCSLCGAEKFVNEKEALGHSYSKDSAVWTWNEDHSKATVTLTCSNDSTHTKELNAVITTNGGDVCVGGEVTFTATASFNKITYTATATGQVEGIGHTPGSQWDGNDEYHYHICSVCGEAVGKAAHQWERKVIKAATCGKNGSAVDTCSVCGEEKNVVLEATGEHTYKNGVCSSCGYVEGSCDHSKKTVVEIDLSEYGVCGGTASVRVCECGKIKEWYNFDVVCDLVDEKEEVDEEAGYVSYAAGCPVCGMKVSVEQKRILNKEECSSYWIFEYCIKMGNTIILETYEESEPSQHPLVVKHDPVNMADFGLCAQTRTNTTCYCGLRSSWSVDGEGEGCDYNFDESGNNFSCSKCGTTGTIATKRTEDGCRTLTEAVVTYYKNSAKVFSFTERSLSVDHYFKLESYEMDGETCSDGVNAFYACVDCGETERYFYTDCVTMLVEQVIDTSHTASCTPGIEIRICPCGDFTSWRFVSDEEDTDHDWTYRYVEKLETWVQTCDVCNFQLYTQTDDYDPSNKDEDCRIHYTLNCTYTNGKENGTFTWVENVVEILHNNTYTFEMFGESCEDGYKVFQLCSDCGTENEWTNDYHEMYTAEKLDLSEYGYCSGVITSVKCPCGKYSDVYCDDRCYWVPISGDEGFEEWRCEVCGIVRQIRWSESESEEPCTTIVRYEYTYLKDGEVIGSLVSVRSNVNHRYIFELTLKDGATSCDGGVYARGTCLDCGNTVESEHYGCHSEIVSRQLVSTEDMCGEMEIVTQSCACGKYTDNGIHWVDGNSCEFYSGDQVYNEEYDAWQYFCSCGASRIYHSKRLAVEGDPCQVRWQSMQYYFAPNGELIGQVSNDHIEPDHAYMFRYELLGETCDDGWTYSRVCADCGKTDSYDGIEYGCSGNFVSRDLIFESEEICGPVYLYHASCACGRLSSYDVSTFCEGSRQNGLFTCNNCGLQYRNLYDYERRPGTCLEDVTMTYTFMVDGEIVNTVSKTYVRTSHEGVYQLILLGETCEDGYRVVEGCAFCDYEYMHEDIYYDHDTYCVEYYEMPEGSCGGYIRVASCACGLERDVWDNVYCSMSGTVNTETDENGIVHRYETGKCNNCDMSFSRDGYNLPGADDCHSVNYTNLSYFYDEITLALSVQEVVSNHDWDVVRLELKEGSVSCSDGVHVFAQCDRCATTDDWYTSGHETYVNSEKTIDLAAYGSVCGAKLELHSCACGEKNYYDFSDDTQCDVGRNWIEDWIDGVLDNSYQTTEGWQDVSSYAYERYCAVTDPACGLRIRMAQYWLNENCTAVEYQTWQLGYDPETGTCQKEITIATGNRKTYHAYQTMPELNGTEDGMRILERKSVCPDCGSYDLDRYYYDDEDFICKYVEETVSTLDNGENKRMTRINEYVYFTDLSGEDVSLTKMYRSETVYNDGSVYWQQTDYTYDFTEGCNCTRIYTNSDGESYTENMANGHSIVTHYEIMEWPTCTQSGVRRITDKCRFCGLIEGQEYVEILPNDHSWNYDTEKQVSVCSTCGLESQNGVSGSIWLEDLSDEASYIVGYYCASDISFSPYVSLILYDAAEGEDDELVLDTVTVSYLTAETDGIRGLSFSKAATAEAAAAALQAAGYTGRYAVRISCVPVGGYDTLDYAVTFETLTAE